MAKCWETATKPYARIIENTNSIISKLKVKLLENLEGHVKYFLLLSLSQQYVISFPIAKISLIVLLILTKENTQQLIYHDHKSSDYLYLVIQDIFNIHISELITN